MSTSRNWVMAVIIITAIVVTLYATGAGQMIQQGVVAVAQGLFAFLQSLAPK